MAIAIPGTAGAQHKLATGANLPASSIPSDSKEAKLALKNFYVAPGLKVELWAAEPLLANPVAFNFDGQGRAYVCETFRLHAGVDDIRGIMPWLDEELAARTVDDRLAEMKRHLGARFSTYSDHSERISRLEDRTGQGRADHATVFAEGFNTPLDGIGAGVLARNGKVWYANIPNLWLLRDTNQDGVADVRQSLHYGFGVRVGFLGHDLHGVHFGPDGKLYFSIGDRGSSITVAEGRTVGELESGCVFRCNPDGSELEVFAFGLRNPQDLAFDQYGNLFTGDNNSDSGDEARWAYLVEGGDSGWRVGYQFMENPYSRGPFNAEKLWHPPFPGQAAYIVPPVTNIADGPSGVAYFPGTGLPQSYSNHFFLVDFRGGAANSGVHTFTLKPKGAGFELTEPRHFLWGVLATDVKFGPSGGLYVSDWVEGWEMTGKGRIYRVHDPALDHDPLVLETKQLLKEGMGGRPIKALAALLAHPDQRVRQEAQFALANQPSQAISTLATVAKDDHNQLARVHAIWALGQISAGWSEEPVAPSAAAEPGRGAALVPLLSLLADADPEIRAQAAKVLGDRRCTAAYGDFLKLLRDRSPRVRFFAALGLGKLGRPGAIPAIYDFLRDSADQDTYLRHAGVMALTWIADRPALAAAAHDNSPAIRMAALLAMRRLQCVEIGGFLKDSDPAIVLEAARAINDRPIAGAQAELAALLDTSAGSEPLLRRVLNANFHIGSSNNAAALAAFAARTGAPENMRAEALAELGDWSHPSGRDRVIGLWRPSAGSRHGEDAAAALQTRLPDLLGSAPATVAIAAIQAANALRVNNLAPELTALVANTNRPGEVRVQALKTLGNLDAPGLPATLSFARTDPNADLRRAATLLQAKAQPNADAAASLAVTLDSSSQGEQQAAFAALGNLPGPAADAVLARWLGRLRAGQVAPGLQLDLVEAAARREAPAVKEELAAYRAAKTNTDSLADFRETLFGGDAKLGRKVFFDRPETQCVRCHKIAGQGGEVGPDLSHVGGQKNREYLLESVVAPNQQIAQGFESVMVVLTNGDSFSGVLKSETADQLVLNSADTGLVTVKKADIQTRRKALSPMPEGLAQIVPRLDLRNLIEFLASLK